MARIETDPNYTSPTFSRATAPTDPFKKEDVQQVAAALSTHVHDGAGKGLPIIIPANAITQTGRAVGSTSGPTTTSTSYADLPDMSVTLTTVGGDLLVWLVVSVFESPGFGDACFVAVSLDAATEVGEISGVSAIAGAQLAITAIARFTGVAAGAHTVKGRWKVGTGTYNCALIRRTLLVEELKK